MAIFLQKKAAKISYISKKIICTKFFASLVTNTLVPNLCEIYAVSASAMRYSKGIFSFIALLCNKKQTTTCTE